MSHFKFKFTKTVSIFFLNSCIKPVDRLSNCENTFLLVLLGRFSVSKFTEYLLSVQLVVQTNLFLKKIYDYQSSLKGELNPKTKFVLFERSLKITE